MKCLWHVPQAKDGNLLNDVLEQSASHSVRHQETKVESSSRTVGLVEPSERRVNLALGLRRCSAQLVTGIGHQLQRSFAENQTFRAVRGLPVLCSRVPQGYLAWRYRGSYTTEVHIRVPPPPPLPNKAMTCEAQGKLSSKPQALTLKRRGRVIPDSARLKAFRPTVQ